MRKSRTPCYPGDADLSANQKFHRYFEMSSRWKTREKTRFVSISPGPAGQCKNIGSQKEKSKRHFGSLSFSEECLRMYTVEPSLMKWCRNPVLRDT